jgi:hypothetical protein
MSEITGPNEPLPLPPERPAAVPAGTPTAPLRPVPFEDLEAHAGFWARVGGMFQMVFRNPLELFDRVPLTEGLGAPWRFLLLLSVPIFLLVAGAFFLLGMTVILAALEQAGRDGKVVAAVLPMVFLGLLLLMPLFTFLGMVIGGALNHAFLWMWGGLRPGVGAQQSIRAYGYAHAFLQLAGLIPAVGTLVQIAGLVVIGMGLARMHRTDTWRGICAVLTPVFLACCCLLPILLMVLPALAAFGHR